ncbi:MAG: lipase family protein, partial [Steroidobacteraceae bacterium]
LTALQVLACEDSYDAAVAAAQPPGSAITDPPLDARLAAEWTVRGALVGTDSLWRKGMTAQLADRTVFYGWLLQSRADPRRFLCLIRGTAGFIEWIEDAEFELVRHPKAGSVEHGFWNLYHSMAFRAPGGTADAPLVASLTAIVGEGTLTVAGHSLGSALATYLTLDLADPGRLGARVAGRYFASPRPGDGLFAQYFSASVPDACAWAWGLDLVPRIPFGFSYSPLLCTRTLDPDRVPVRPCFGIKCQHHVLGYALMIDPSVVDLSTLPAMDKPYLDCLRLPVPAAA